MYEIVRADVRRHGDARSRRRPTRRPPAPRLWHRPGHLATAKDGEGLTKECFGDRVVWVPWRRPGLQLGLDIAPIKRSNPAAIGCILGGHGITAWAQTSEQCEANSLEIIRTAEAFLVERGRPEPFGAVVPGFEALPKANRHARAAALAPVIRGLASTDHPQVGNYTDSDAVLEF